MLEKLKFGMKLNDRLEKEMDHSLACMATLDPESDAYAKALEGLEKLQDLRNKRKIRKPSPDTVLSIAGSLLGIGIISFVELKGGIFTSKATSFIPRKF